MRPEQLFGQFFQQFNQVIGPSAQALSDDVKQQLRAAMMAAFDKLDLVSREEFDAQRAVLARTREKIDALEKQLAALELTMQSQANNAISEENK